MPRWLTRLLWTFLAAIFLIEAWLWDVLGGLIGRLVAILPVERARRALRAIIDRLPAPFSLALFVLPILVILPFKLAALALLAKGKIGLGCGVFLAAKTAGLGATAFVFDVCHERLMTMAWFARFYARVIAVKDWAHRQIDPYRAKIIALRHALAAAISARLSTGAPSFAQKIAVFRATLHARRRTS